MKQNYRANFNYITDFQNGFDATNLFSPGLRQFTKKVIKMCQKEIYPLTNGNLPAYNISCASRGAEH